MTADSRSYPHTPDGRYFVVRGRLWRLADPALLPAVRAALVSELMDARRTLRGTADDAVVQRLAHARVDAAKRALGERGPVWWTDGAPDFNRRMVANSPYAAWFGSLAAKAAKSVHKMDEPHPALGPCEPETP